MKKFLIIIMLLSSYSANAQMGKNAGFFFTFPAAANINQEEYHYLCMSASSLEGALVAKRDAERMLKPMTPWVTHKEMRDAEIAYLKTVRSPTAKRLIEDLNLNSCYIVELGLYSKIWNNL